MFFFDSHCHLDDLIFNRDFDEVMNRSLINKVLGITVVGVDELTSIKAVELSITHSRIYSSVGFHPHNANRCDGCSLERLRKITKNSKVVAWGEIGLDFNRMYSDRKQQESCLIRQMEIADDLKLPIIFHERDSEGRLIEILDAYPNQSRSAVVHCFSGNYGELKHYLELGFYIGITGIISILKRGRQLRDMVKYIPSDKLLIETDAPYLIPAPYKNKMKRNEPAFVKSILLKLAKVRNENAFLLAKQIWKNSCVFFGVYPEIAI